MRKNKEISYDVAENRKRKHTRIQKKACQMARYPTNFNNANYIAFLFF